MALYKLILKVKDSSGKEKEIDAGTVSIDLSTLTETEIAQVTEQLNPYFATDAEVEAKDTIKYSNFELKPEE